LEAGADIEILEIDDFEAAVRTAAKAAKDGDIVLLSPSSASFDRFTNFEERGNTYKKIVMSL
jgi:UDP-N-acetylmuramoylalanine--D-glutamate ligase